jgi:hypothetical protein
MLNTNFWNWVLKILPKIVISKKRLQKVQNPEKIKIRIAFCL